MIPHTEEERLGRLASVEAMLRQRAGKSTDTRDPSVCDRKACDWHRESVHDTVGIRYVFERCLACGQRRQRHEEAPRLGDKHSWKGD